MSIPFDRICFLRDVGHVSPDIWSMTFPECVIVIVIFQSSNLSSVLVQSSTPTLFPLRTWSDWGDKRPVEVLRFQSAGTRARVQCTSNRICSATNQYQGSVCSQHSFPLLIPPNLIRHKDASIR